MKIVIPGGSGQVGQMLARAFEGKGREVVILSRSSKPKHAAGRWVQWTMSSSGDWSNELEGALAVINLVGRSVNCRYSPENRKAILESRITSTSLIGDAIRKCRNPPPIWLQASTATIYAHRYDAANDELTGILGGTENGVPDTWKFSIEVAQAWEKALNESQTPRTRKVALRSAMTMSPDPGGVFATLLGLVRIGLGGQIGNGRQYMSWIHEYDFVRGLDWIIDHPELDGAINLASPFPIPQKEFMKEFRKAWGMPIGIPAMEWMVEIGTWGMRTESELVFKSRRVVPTRLLQSGFNFEFATWPLAAADLCQRWQARRTPTHS